MSRTWVHTPYKFKLRQYRWRHLFVEDHDHRKGVCDIDRFDPEYWSKTWCVIREVSDGTNPHCGCRLCTGHVEGRARIKSERRRQRMNNRNAVKEA